MITRHQLSQVIGERTLEVRDINELARQVAAYLIQEHRTGEIGPLMRDIMQYRFEHGIVEAAAISAHELTPEVLRDVEHILRAEFPHAKEYIVREKRDPDVIGGIRIEMANEQLDLTVKSKLNTFKRLTAAVKE